MTRDPFLLGLSGLAGAGKDTAAEYLVDRYGFLQLALAEPLNDMLATMLEQVGIDYDVLHERHLKERPLDQLQGLSPRQLKQSLGDWGRALSPTFWLRLAEMRLGLTAGQSPIHDRVVVSDVRFANEAEWLRARGGHLARIHRPGVAPVRGHVSEWEQAGGQFARLVHTTVVNDSTVGMLHERIDQLCNELGLERREPVL